MKARCEFRPFTRTPKWTCRRPAKPCSRQSCPSNLCPKHQQLHDKIHGAGDRWLTRLLGEPTQ